MEQSGMVPLARPATTTGPVTSAGALEIRHGGQSLRGLADVEEYLLNRVADADRGDAMDSIRDQLLRAYNVVGDAIDQYVTMIDRHHMLSALASQDEQAWEAARLVAKDQRSKRARVQGAYDTIATAWGAHWETTFGYSRDSLNYNLLEQVRKLTRVTPDMSMAKRLIDMCICQRRSERKQGVSSSAQAQPRDFANAAQYVAQIPNRRLTNDELNGAGITYGNNDVLVIATTPALGTGRAQTVFETGNEGTGSTSRPSAQGTTSPRSPQATHSPTSPLPHRRVPQAVSPQMARSPASPLPHRRMPQSTSMRSILSSAPSDTLSTILDEDELLLLASEAGLGDSLAGYQEASVQTRSRAAGARESSSYRESNAPETPLPPGQEASYVSPDNETPAGGRCTCGPTTTAGLKTRMNNTGTMSNAEVLRLVGEALRADRAGNVCYAHLQKVAAKVGLQTRKLSKGGLLDRLQTIDNARGTLGPLKTDLATYQWFRQSARPPRPTDALGVYRLQPSTEPSFTVDPQYVQRALFNNMSEQWHQDGSVVRELFKWLMKSPVWPAMREELNMYNWHLRKIGGRSNQGWLRNCFHSVLQQVVRQDLSYYAAYVALRPDNAYRLVSYPYYMKFASTGDPTFFRHIDLNVPDLIKGRGANQIQGTVSFSDESPENCTELVLGMHRCLKQWWDRVEQRRLSSDSFVHRITDQMLSRQDLDDFGLKWTNQPCRAGDIRISLPHLPHGAKGPSIAERITVMPWYIAVSEDKVNLEVADAGTVSDIAAAHRNLVAGPSSPSGLTNQYGGIPFKFPAAVEVRGISSISDALLGLKDWDSILVRKELEVLFGSDAVARNALLTKSKNNAVRSATAALQLVREEEMRVFGVKSYYYCKAHNVGSVPDDDTAPSEAEIAADPTVRVSPGPSEQGTPRGSPRQSRAVSPGSPMPWSPGPGSPMHY